MYLKHFFCGRQKIFNVIISHLIDLAVKLHDLMCVLFYIYYKGIVKPL